jgi:hypothetical protein
MFTVIPVKPSPNLNAEYVLAPSRVLPFPLIVTARPARMGRLAPRVILLLKFIVVIVGSAMAAIKVGESVTSAMEDA